MITISALVFLAVSLGLASIYLWVVPSRTEQRLQNIGTTPTDRSSWTETVLKMVGPMAKLSVPTGDWESSPLRLRFLNAGIRHPDARLAYFGAKTFLPLFLSTLAYVSLRGASQGLTLIFYVLMAALIGCYLPNLLLHLKIKSRQREI